MRKSIAIAVLVLSFGREARAAALVPIELSPGHSLILTDQAPAPGNYSQGRVFDAGTHLELWTAGQTGNDPKTDVVEKGMEAQAAQTLKNLQAVIQAAGGTLSDVVKAQVYMQNMTPDDKAAFERAYTAAFAGRPFPTRVLTGGAQIPLPGEGTIVEVAFEARVPKGRPAPESAPSLGRIANEALSHIEPYIFGRLKEWGAQAAAAGKDVIDLGQGSPDLPPPQAALDALTDAVANPKNHSYPVANGMPEFRSEIARWYQNRFGVALDPNKEIFPLAGSKQGLDHLMAAMIEPGDGILVPDPGYPAWASQVKASNGKVIPMKVDEASGFMPDLDAVAAQAKEARAQGHPVRAMILNFPSNPTGAVADLPYLTRASAFAREHGLLMIYDNAYSEIGFDGYRSPTMLQVPGARENTIEFHSFSKTYSMAGHRVAFAVGMGEAVAALAKRAGYNMYGLPTFIQAGAMAALQEGAPYVANLRTTYQARRDAMLDELRKIGWEVRPPKGAMYLWAKLPAQAAQMTSVEFVQRLISEFGVIVSPGSAFGPNGESYVRISLINHPERLREAARRIGEFLATLKV